MLLPNLRKIMSIYLQKYTNQVDYSRQKRAFTLLLVMGDNYRLLTNNC